MAPLRLSVLVGAFGVAKLAPGFEIPTPDSLPDIWSLTVTPDEVSLLTYEANIPAGSRVEMGWAGVKVEGVLDFGLTGILSGLLTPLAEHGISVFVLSTFDTDYIFVRKECLSQLVAIFTKLGHVWA